MAGEVYENRDVTCDDEKSAAEESSRPAGVTPTPAPRSPSPPSPGMTFAEGSPAESKQSPSAATRGCSWAARGVRRMVVGAPPRKLRKLLNILTYTVIILMLWAISYSVLGSLALPGYDPIVITIHGGTVFSLLVLLVAAHVGGWLVSLVRLPALLGMLLVGILLKNVPYIDVGRGIDPAWAGTLRSTALAVILLRAGLGLDPTALKQLSAMVFRLAFSPCLAETLVVGVTSHFLLGFPWLWGFMLGFVLAAVSPAVVVPCLLSLQERGFGVAKGIPTLVIAAASLDDVLAISAFTIILGITFNSEESLEMLILQGPIEAVVGIVFGLAWGAVVVFLPPQPRPQVLARVVLLFGGSLLALFGSAEVGLPGSGALAVLIMAFVAGLGWRVQGWSNNNPVSGVLASLWRVFQPLLFGLIGTEIQVSELQGETVGLGVAVLMCGLALRICISYLAVCRGPLTHKERVFVALAWLPKATVQAAIGPLALDMAVKGLRAAESRGEEDEEVMMQLATRVELATKILTIAVLVILITAPIGAVSIMLAGPKLLANNKDPESKSADTEAEAKEGKHETTNEDEERT